MASMILGGLLGSVIEVCCTAVGGGLLLLFFTFSDFSVDDNGGITLPVKGLTSVGCFW